MCTARGVPLLLIPEVMRTEVLSRGEDNKPDPDGSYHKIFQLIADEFLGQGVHSVSLAPRYDAKLVYSYFHDEVHMNAEGYSYLARLIADAVMERGLIGPPAEPGPGR